MNKTLFAAALALLPLAAHAQAPNLVSGPLTIAQDNAGNAAYTTGAYDTLNGGTGFGAFKVVTSVSSSTNAYAGSFVGTAAGSEGGNGNPASIDSSGKSFGTYANGTSNGAGDPSVTASRTFNVGPTTGGSFSLDFVTGYNDGANGGGLASVALTNTLGAFGTFAYVSNNSYTFNGATITGQGYTSGPFHLTYNITSPTTYSLVETGPFSFTGAGTFAGPILGFQVQQANSAGGGGDHDGFFNNLKETAAVPAAVPEASTTVSLGLLLALGLGGFAIARKRRIAA